MLLIATSIFPNCKKIRIYFSLMFEIIKPDRFLLLLACTSYVTFLITVYLTYYFDCSVPLLQVAGVITILQLISFLCKYYSMSVPVPKYSWSAKIILANYPPLSANIYKRDNFPPKYRGLYCKSLLLRNAKFSRYVYVSWTTKLSFRKTFFP